MQIWTAFQEFEADLALINVTVKTLSVKKERMIENAIGNFCTVTELANYLVRHDGISFRSAHNVVAMLVAYMQEHQKLANEITVADINPICISLLGRQTTLNDSLVQEALDPSKNAQAKKTIGGANTKEVLRQLNRLEKNLTTDQNLLNKRFDQVIKAKNKLEETVQAVISTK